MVVRFLPVPDPDAQANPDPAPEREGLAEVVELRSRLLGAVAKSGAEGWSGEVSAEEDGDDPFQRGSSRARSQAPRSSTGRPSARRQARVTSLGGSASAAGEARGSGGRFGRDDEGQAPQGPSRTATEDGVRVLARRARSVGEVRRALLDLGHDAAEVEDVLAEFTRSGYLDDADLARAVTASLRERSKASRSQIRRKLVERKLPDAEIETALSELDADSELELLQDAAFQRAGRMRDLDHTTAERRLLGFLARRGWSGEPARSAVNAALASVGLRR